MIVRKYRSDDYDAVMEIYQRCHNGNFNPPNLSNTVDNCVVEKDGKVIAYGGLELLLECVLVLDKEVGKKDQVKALKLMVEVGDVSSKLKGFRGFYSFPQPESWLEILKRKFRFKDCPKLLYRSNDGE